MNEQPNKKMGNQCYVRSRKPETTSETVVVVAMRTLELKAKVNRTRRNPKTPDHVIDDLDEIFGHPPFSTCYGVRRYRVHAVYEHFYRSGIPLSVHLNLAGLTNECVLGLTEPVWARLNELCQEFG